jgi:type IV pilus assembly protein PilC
MPEYKYQVQTSKGQTNAGVVSAPTAVAAADLLRAKGDRLLQLSPVAGSSKTMGERWAAMNQRSGPSQRDILNFTMQLAVMIRAGISLRAAIEGIADQMDNLGFKKILLAIKSDLESGKPFSDSLVSHPKQFNILYVNMVRASEMSGSFSRMLDRIAAHLAQQIETRAMVIGALIYPAGIATMAIGVTIFLLTFVLPRFAGIFEGKESAMPAPTLILMALSAFMVQWWWLVVGGILAAIGGMMMFVRTNVGGWWFDRMKLIVPLFRKMFRALYISRSLHTMGELINAGVPMLDTLSITGQIAGNRLYQRLWAQVHAAVSQGKKISQPLSRGDGLLPKTVIQMVAAGEESGKLGEVLDEISGHYAKQLKEVIKTVTSMIEPIMIVIMGGIVGFIAMAIILPIFKLSTLVK